jgi:hypothetical protein
MHIGLGHDTQEKRGEQQQQQGLMLLSLDAAILYYGDGVRTESHVEIGVW